MSRKEDGASDLPRTEESGAKRPWLPPRLIEIDPDSDRHRTIAGQMRKIVRGD